MASLNPIGYGPNKSLHFSGDVEAFELWAIKFKAYLRLNKLYKTLTTETEGDEEKNAELYATLVQVLDDKSLNLIIRDAEDDGRKAFEILQDHYQGTSKPKIISLYCELTSLKKSTNETVTEYMLRAETTATRLKQAKENVSEGLLIAMVLKGLPDSYKAFSTIITQADEDKMDFQKFKVSLRSYEESEAARSGPETSKDDVFSLNCFRCGKPGHLKKNCRAKFSTNKKKYQERWCTHCKTATHDTEYCRHLKNKNSENKSTTKSMQENDDFFCFKLSVYERDIISASINKDSLLVDCGATTHIVCDEACFTSNDNSFDSNTHIIELADGSRKRGIATKRGDAVVAIRDQEGKVKNIMLKRALCIPSYKQNIISVHALTENGIKVLFSKDQNCIKVPNGTVFKMFKSGKLYYLEGASKQNTDNISKVTSKSLQMWHNTLGHWNTADIIETEKCSQGMKITDKSKFDCSTCIEAKMTQVINHKPDAKATKILELVHSDLCGPLSPASIQGCKYVINFVDDYSGLTTVYFLKAKSDAIHAMRKFIADMAPYGEIRRLRTDNGGEYTSKEFEELMVKNKIRHEFSAPYSAHQNGTAERSWRTLFNLARAMLLESGLPKELWTYAVRHGTFIQNRVHNKQIKMSPFEKFMGKKPCMINMTQFGSKCFTHNREPKSKLDARGKLGFYLGQDTHSPASMIYDLANRKVTKARTIRHAPEEEEEADEEDDVWIYPIQNVPAENEEEQEAPPSPPGSPRSSLVTSSSEGEDFLDAAELDANPAVKPKAAHTNISELPSRYPSRKRSLPKYLGDYDISQSLNDCSIDYFCRVSDIPQTYHEAMQSEESNDWGVAMKNEYQALCENETFDLVQKPNKKVVGGRWVYSKKRNENGVEIFKARYVAKGFSQVPNIDYSETFSPTAKLTSIRVVLQIAVNDNMCLSQMDVKTAYLNAPLDHTIYVKQPQGFQKLDEDGNELVWKLNKSLYGLKQSGRMWNNCLHDFLTENDFTQLIPDNCIYVRVQNNLKVIIVVWVDDLVIAASCPQAAASIKDQLSLRFSMKDFGALTNFLGIQFELSESCTKMHQSEYAQKILDRFQMCEANAKSIPCDLSTCNIDFDDNSPYLDDPTLYREIVGSLIYLMTCSRPDLCYVVTILSQYMSKPKVGHLKLAKYVLRYLKGTVNFGIVFKKSSLSIVGFTDASWGSTGDRRSISGLCFKLGTDASLISWKSKKQPIVALSSCEAEYVSMTHSIQEGVFLQQLLAGLQFKDAAKVVSLYVDNKGAIDLAKNPVHHQRSKHVDIKYHYIRSKILDGSFVLYYVPSKENLADIFTKPCTKNSLRIFNIVENVF